jgi:methyl-accepting chemotaxis protein
METAARMKTAEGRKTTLASRERMIDEIRASVEQLAHTIDGVQALAAEKRPDQDLAQIRRELDESLEVARRVEERMQSLEAELGKPAVETSRE